MRFPETKIVSRPANVLTQYSILRHSHCIRAFAMQRALRSLTICLSYYERLKCPRDYIPS